MSTIFVLFVIFGAILCLVTWKAEIRRLELNLLSYVENVEDILETTRYERWARIIENFPVESIQVYNLVSLKLEVAKGSLFPLTKEKLKEVTSKLSNTESMLFTLRREAEEYKCVVVKEENTSFPVLIVLAQSMEEVRDSVYKMAFTMISIFPVVLLIALVGSRLLVNVSLKPLRKIIEVASSLDVNRLDVEIPEVRENDEIGELTRIFNLMIRRLRASVEEIRNFSSRMAHELKTPITVLRAKLELLKESKECAQCRGFLDKVLDDVNRLTDLVDNLLLISKVKRSGEVKWIYTNIDKLILEAIEDFVLSIKDKGIELIIGDWDEVKGWISPSLFKRAVSNLIDNAVKFTPRGGKIELSLKKIGDREAVFTVSDTGKGISEEKLQKVLKGEGPGMGLAIVNKIAALHRAELKVKSIPGKGSSFSLAFPLDNAPEEYKKTENSY